MLALVFGRVAKLPSGGVPYLPFSYAGLLCWNLFSSGLLKSSASLVTNSQLVSKVYFPRLILPLSTFLSTLVDFAVGLVFFGALLAIYRLPVGPSLLCSRFGRRWSSALALGCGLVAGALAVQYRDVQYALPVAVPFLLYASPVAYAVTAVPAAYRWAFAMNPLTAALEGFRTRAARSGTVTTTMLGYSVGMTAVFLLGGVSCSVAWNGGSRMSSESIAISVRGISKRYQIRRASRSSTLAERLSTALSRVGRLRAHEGVLGAEGTRVRRSGRRSAWPSWAATGPGRARF